jgi:hypothetical protein
MRFSESGVGQVWGSVKMNFSQCKVEKMCSWGHGMLIRCEVERYDVTWLWGWENVKNAIQLVDACHFTCYLIQNRYKVYDLQLSCQTKVFRTSSFISRRKNVRLRKWDVEKMWGWQVWFVMIRMMLHECEDEKMWKSDEMRLNEWDVDENIVKLKHVTSSECEIRIVDLVIDDATWWWEAGTLKTFCNSDIFLTFPQEKTSKLFPVIGLTFFKCGMTLVCQWILSRSLSGFDTTICCKVVGHLEF